MTVPPRISVVVPFHDSEAYIQECATALLAQRYPRDRFEIVMIDNNSTDRSATIVSRCPGVRLLSEPTPGAYAARNRGIRESSGDIIAFTDSDCTPDPAWLDAIAAALASPEICVAQGRLRFAFESPGLAMMADYEAAKAAYTFSSGRREIYYAYTNNMAVRRSMFDKAGPFEEWQRGADVVFMQRVIDAYSCGVIRYVPNMCVRHLEITSVWNWLGKMRIYGRSFRRYREHVPQRPLGGRDRVRVFTSTIRGGGYSLLKTLLLGGLLTVGLVAYELGRRGPA
jgi:glycosyltransferase involved in cell wall biosynthesis